MDDLDKSWMKARRLRAEYMKGVDQFSDYAFRNSTRNDNRIKCPCLNCNNVFLKVREEVKYDLCKKGIVPSYTIWYFHSEKESVVVQDDEKSDEELDEEFDGDDMITMLEEGDDELYRQVVGPERHGRTRGYVLGLTPSTVFGTTPGRIELASQLHAASTQNIELRSKIDNLEKKIEDDRKKIEERMEERRMIEERMEVVREKMEEKMEEDRRKMDMLLVFVEEMNRKEMLQLENESLR
ncbi:hypothetical protein CRG98_017896 [Punica granatum]|uniref:Transposase-associated domain-containing protein n=2 Tax=Punica granatum TaxID=22663 RepID=A0A2I0JZI9_PUNGR|nr:hypothetical protein CRG98_017896 [Punica granatum]